MPLSNGDLLYAYAADFGVCSNMYAETQGLLQGVSWLKDHGFDNAIVEMDSKVLLDIVLLKSEIPWRCWHIIQEILKIASSMQLSFQHCFREANKVADSLANVGCGSTTASSFLSTSELPKETLGHFVLDVNGIPSLRVS